MALEILLLFIAYSVFMMLGVYYVRLFLSKDNYTREELKNIIPYFKEFWGLISGSFPIVMFVVIFLLSAFLGIVIPVLLRHWLINSALLVLAFYFGFPVLKKYFEKSQVSESENYADKAETVFVKYSSVINLGFGLGYGSALIYTWSVYNAVHFLWFAINIAVITFFVGQIIISLLDGKK